MPPEAGNTRSEISNLSTFWSKCLSARFRFRKPRLRLPPTLRYSSIMSPLAEIESTADALPPEQKQELILFLATRLRMSGGKLPPPRKFSKEQVAGWIADDEAEMRRFREGA